MSSAALRYAALAAGSSSATSSSSFFASSLSSGGASEWKALVHGNAFAKKGRVSGLAAYYDDDEPEGSSVFVAADGNLYVWSPRTGSVRTVGPIRENQRSGRVRTIRSLCSVNLHELTYLHSPSRGKSYTSYLQGKERGTRQELFGLVPSGSPALNNRVDCIVQIDPRSGEIVKRYQIGRCDVVGVAAPPHTSNTHGGGWRGIKFFVWTRRGGLYGIRWENEYSELKRFGYTSDGSACNDVAFGANGQLFGAGAAGLVEIDTRTGICTPVCGLRRADALLIASGVAAVQDYNPNQNRADAAVLRKSSLGGNIPRARQMAQRQVRISTTLDAFLGSLGIADACGPAFRAQAIDDLVLLVGMLQSMGATEFCAMLKTEVGIKKMGHRVKIATELAKLM